MNLSSLATRTLAALLTLAVPQAAAAAETLTVPVDQATLTKLPERTSVIVIGNPMIADVTLQAGGVLVVTGKGYGATNILALDRAGSVLMEKTILVEGPRDNVVVVYRGAQRGTYSCQPDCQRRITLGDSQDFFNAALAQSAARNAQAQGSAAAAPK
jgi:Flp pilus assembly secretin CpaC